MCFIPKNCIYTIVEWWVGISSWNYHTWLIHQIEMVRSLKNTSTLILGVLIVFAMSAEAVWYPAYNLAQIKTWLTNGNLNNDYLNQSPLQFTVVAAFTETIGSITYFDIWIIVQIGKNQFKICHIKGHKHIKNKYIRITWVKCYKCKKPKHHHSHSTHSHHSHSSHSSSGTSSSHKEN